jgi:hypothetical protein
MTYLYWIEDLHASSLKIFKKYILGVPAEMQFLKNDINNLFVGFVKPKEQQKQGASFNFELVRNKCFQPKLFLTWVVDLHNI